jgi:hypothetical protein
MGLMGTLRPSLLTGKRIVIGSLPVEIERT